MEEVTEDPFYKMMAEDYADLMLDYAVISCGEEYCGETTHIDAVKEFFSLLSSRRREDDEDFDCFTFHEERMSSQKCSVAEFFKTGDKKRPSGYMTYWFAFSQPPCPLPFGEKDFERINAVLFPKERRDALEILCWNDDFSDYFDEGKEWWGTALWSIYDKQARRFVLIGASLTD